MSIQHKKVVIFGAGAVGGSLAAWMVPHHDQTYILDKPEVISRIEEHGLQAYLEGEKEQTPLVHVKGLSDITQIDNADIIIIAVKNYSLDGVAKLIKDNIKGDPIIVALQNGIQNQDILPQYFKKIIYGVVGYNAWLDEPGMVGYQKKGPFILGTPDNTLQEELKEVASYFQLGVETVATDHLQDAAYSKMIINLTNSFTTLVGHKYREISEFSLFKKILTNLLYEGVQIVKASGYKECRLGGMPSWRTMTVVVKLPDFMTNSIFKKNLAKMVLSSMGQDVLQRKGSETELESLNGHFIALANKVGHKAPYNRAVYDMCQEKFKEVPFQPITEEEVWKRIQIQMKKG
ncbi:ketopantoate reductase family protein [Longirhabdus pacifica]|uniref:ketopantoate reductase family protein n=1 Tax=Longirhabdus pacifica TaxID=2305227 RepID=UPI00100879C4|nr:2-dehydropantoate 2-reductase [Longirhabdus pacifica]